MVMLLYQTSIVSIQLLIPLNGTKVGRREKCRRHSLLDIIDPVEQTMPTDATETLTIWIARPPYKDRLTHDMIFWNKAPVTTVGRVMTVVTHHPVVVHLECVTRCRASVDIDLAVLYLQIILLVNLYSAFVNREVIEGEGDSLTLCRNPDRPVIVTSPACESIQWIVRT